MSLLILFLLLLSSFAVADWQHKIYVKSTGVNDTSCLNGGKQTPCATINMALKGVNNSTGIYIYPGIHTLQPGIETEVSGKSHVGIIGLANENLEVVVSCYPLTGVSFIMSDNIIIESLTIRGCGSLQVFEFHTFQVAVYMLYCYNVHINSTVIESSNGTGLIMYNTVGNVTIQSCTLRENGQESSNKGGGILIEFLKDMYSDSLMGHRFAFYTIINSTFISNNAYSSRDKSSGCYNLANQCVSGCGSCGGGISIILRGQASNNVFLMDTCVMEGNSANHGSGFYIAFHDEAYNNTVNISNSQVHSNMNHDMEQLIEWNDHRGGGGGKVVQSANNNTFNIIDSYISNNTAVTGGGISLICGNSHLSNITIHNTSMVGNKAFTGLALHSASEYHTVDMYVEISDCKIHENSPVCSNNDTVRHLLSRQLVPSGAISTVGKIYFKGNNVFENNNASSLTAYYRSEVVILNNSSLHFTNNSGEYGGAIALFDCSYIIVYPEVQLYLANNHASAPGGAIYSGSCTLISYIFYCFIQYYDPYVHPDEWDVKFNFASNTYEDDYGSFIPNAIYSASLSLCWWPLQNSSYITTDAIKNTLCWNNWYYSPDNCSMSVMSDVAYFNTNYDIEVYPGGRLLPPLAYDGSGNMIDITEDSICITSGPARFCDDENQTYACSSFGTDSLQVCNRGCETFNETNYVTVASSSGVESTFTFKFTKYPSWQFRFDSDDRCDKYILSSKIPGLTCFKNSPFSPCFVDSYYRLKAGYCLSNDSLIGTCPTTYSYLIGDFICTEISATELACTGQYLAFTDLLKHFPECNDHHNGRLCGGCENEYSIPINSPILSCMNCTDSLVKGWFIFILGEMIPVTLLVTLILILNINFTQGSSNGYLFYSHSLTILIPRLSIILFDSLNNIDFTIFILPFSIWNLDFLFSSSTSSTYEFTDDSMIKLNAYTQWPVCISSKMTPLGAISFWYLIASYPLVLLLLLYVWIIMYEKGFRCVVYITRPIHRLLARFWRMFDIEPSLIHSIASVYVLCFTQFTSISLKLLHFSKWQSLVNENENGYAFFYDGTMDYFGWPHAVAGLFAILILLLVVLLPMLYLLFYPMKVFQRLLDKMKFQNEFLKMLMDVFTGPFKDGTDNSKDYRWFAVIYLLLRVITISFYYIPYEYHVIAFALQLIVFVITGGVIIIFRPYKRNIHNFSEFLLISILAVINILPLVLELRSTVYSLVPWVVYLPLMYSPVLIVILYCIYWIIKKIKKCCVYCKSIRRNPPVVLNDEEEDVPQQLIINDNDDLFADRIMNPDDYDEKHAFSIPDVEVSLGSKTVHTSVVRRSKIKAPHSVRLVSPENDDCVMNPDDCNEEHSSVLSPSSLSSQNSRKNIPLLMTASVDYGTIN